ncbi:hypothetical protein, partial [Burkholderia cepacia]|uniref:hypothetical protein n=1 Tax=Burkholderia cepacia TaxID=292 RepID=UPI001E598883
MKENNVTGFFQIPGVTLLYKDEKGNSLKALSLVKVELQNFSSRDIARETLINGPTSEVAGEMASNFLDDE